MFILTICLTFIQLCEKLTSDDVTCMQYGRLQNTTDLSQGLRGQNMEQEWVVGKCGGNKWYEDIWKEEGERVLKVKK